MIKKKKGNLQRKASRAPDESSSSSGVVTAAVAVAYVVYSSMSSILTLNNGFIVKLKNYDRIPLFFSFIFASSFFFPMLFRIRLCDRFFFEKGSPLSCLNQGVLSFWAYSPDRWVFSHERLGVRCNTSRKVKKHCSRRDFNQHLLRLILSFWQAAGFPQISWAQIKLAKQGNNLFLSFFLSLCPVDPRKRTYRLSSGFVT